MPRRLTEKCDKCDLSDTCKSCCIGGTGSESPKIIFIGSNPSEEEDERGSGFVGKAGQYLISSIERLGIKDSRFTYTVRCCPPNGKNPLKRHVEPCLDYLAMELELYPCEVIVPMGALALKTFSDGKITNLAGKPMTIDGGVLFPIISPSAPLTRPAMKREFELQLKALASYVNKERANTRPTHYQIFDDFPQHELKSNLQTRETFAYDFETEGLDPRTCALRCTGFSNRVGTAVCIKNSGTIPTPFWHQNDFITHASKFEYKFTAKNWCGVEPNIVDDTQIAHHLLYEDERHHLDQLSQIYTSIGGFKQETVDWLNENDNDWRNMPIGMLMRRNCGDVDATLRIRNIFRKQLKEQNLTWIYENIALPMAWAVARIENRGMYVNTEVLNRIKEEESVRAEKMKAGILERYELEDLNFRSPKQMKELLFDKMGMPICGKTKSGGPSTDEQALKQMMCSVEGADREALQHVLDTRSALYNMSKIDELFKWRRDDGTVSSDLNISYTPTGRLTSKEPNLQNLPTDGRVKEAFESRFRGGQILEADYSQLELRLIASESGCRDLIDAYKAGRDIHEETNVMFGLNDRNKAKRINFAVAYGVGAGTLSKELNCTFMEAKEYLREKNKQWWEIGLWRQTQHDFARTNGYVVNRFGRRKRLDDILSVDDHSRFSAERVAGNFPIQSLGADTLNYAIVNMEAQMYPKRNVFQGGKDMDLNSIIIMQIHDSIIMDVAPDDDLDVIKELLVNNMITKPTKFGWYKVPLEIEIGIGSNWKEAK